jgi:hypothetical protein
MAVSTQSVPTQAEVIEKLRQFFATQPLVAKAWLFGSYARNEQNEGSDVDVLFEMDDEFLGDGMEYVRLWLEVNELLGLKTDLVDEAALRPRIRPYVNQDKVLFYEKAAR